MKLRGNIILPYLSTNRNSQIELKCSSFSVESALSTIPKGFPLPKEKHGKPLGDLLLWGKRAAEGVGPYRGNVRCSGEMKEMQ